MADKIGTDEYGEILIYQTDDGQTNIEVKIEDDTVWLTQQQLTELYQCSKSNISEHIKHIFEEGELDKDSVVRKFRTTADDGKTYNVTSILIAKSLLDSLKLFRINFTMQHMVILRQRLYISGQMQKSHLWDLLHFQVNYQH